MLVPLRYLPHNNWYKATFLYLRLAKNVWLLIPITHIIYEFGITTNL